MDGLIGIASRVDIHTRNMQYTNHRFCDVVNTGNGAMSKESRL
jgi:hypothetical protein